MENKEQINKMYEKIAEELNISESVYEKANNSYISLEKYLQSELKDYDVNIFPQGSMNLGTIIKPVVEEDDYDLDAVCKIYGTFNDASTLKKLVGEALKNNKMYSKMLQPEGKRCWTLKYSDDSHFHMDILPSCPSDRKDKSIKITHKENGNYKFMISNPEEYAEWFNKLQESERRRIYFTRNINFSSKIEDLRRNNIRTTLQKTIQILKRHRDIKYMNASDIERENKPISIIITTIVGKMYTGSEDIYDLILKFTTDYMKYIEIDSHDNYIIKSPVDDKENFADKWNIYPERSKAFFAWISDLKKDLITNNFTLKEGLIEKSDYLKGIFGERTISNVFEKIDGASSKSYINHDNIATITSTKTDIEIKEHTFFGK